LAEDRGSMKSPCGIPSWLASALAMGNGCCVATNRFIGPDDGQIS
jgi:hypothetical protein